MLSSRLHTLPEPFGTMAREVDEVLGQIGTPPSPAPVSLWENDQNVYLEVDVPGFNRDELDLTIEDGRLLISGERKSAAREGKCWYDERRYGRFERMIALSNLVDPERIEAQLENGVLFLTLPKKPEAQPHRIPIKGADAASRARLTEGSEHAKA